MDVPWNSDACVTLLIVVVPPELINTLTPFDLYILPKILPLALISPDAVILPCDINSLELITLLTNNVVPSYVKLASSSKVFVSL